MNVQTVFQIALYGILFKCSTLSANATFTIGMYEVPGILEKPKPGSSCPIGGTAASYSWAILSSLSTTSNISIVWTENGDQVGVKSSNGSYSGLIGLLQRNEADISNSALGFPLSTFNVVDYSAVAYAARGVLIHFPQVGYTDRNIVSTLNVFRPPAYICIAFVHCFLSILIIVVLKHSDKLSLRAYIRFHFQLFGCQFLQTDISECRRISCYFVLTLLGGFFFLAAVFENAINADHVSKDYGNIVNSLKDMHRLTKYKPVMVVDGALTEVFRQGRSRMYRSIWNRVKRCGFDKCLISLTPEKLPQLDADMVFIGQEYQAMCVERIQCARNIQHKSWFAPKPYANVNYAFYISKTVSKAGRRHIDLMVERMAASDLLRAAYVKGASDGVRPIASESCETNQIDDLFPEINESLGLGFKQFSSALKIFLISLGLSLIAIMIEKLSYIILGNV